MGKEPLSAFISTEILMGRIMFGIMGTAVSPFRKVVSVTTATTASQQMSQIRSAEATSMSTFGLHTAAVQRLTERKESGAE